MAFGQASGGRLAVGEIAVAIGVLSLGLVVLWQASDIPVSPIYAKVGPTAAPYMCAFGLIAMGAALVWEAFRGGWQPDEEKEVAQDRVALGWVGAGSSSMSSPSARSASPSPRCCSSPAWRAASDRPTWSATG